MVFTQQMERLGECTLVRGKKEKMLKKVLASVTALPTMNNALGGAGCGKN